MTVSGHGARGIFPSRKSAKPAQYESLIEEMVLRFLEIAPSVKSIATQPQVFEYPDGTYPIVQGSSQYTIEGRAVALDRMKTACGASLIASQQEFLASE